MSGVDFKNVTVQMEQAMLDQLDSRAHAADLNRSQYLRRLIRRDLGLGLPEVDQTLLPVLNGKHEVAA